MGLKHEIFLAASAACLFSSGLLNAAPVLRLVASTVGPLSIAQGSNGATQTVQAYNAGDGSLNLTLSSSVTWITGTVGAQRACTSPTPGNCIPLQLALNTASLPAGTATGIVTVSDPNAVDAPQTIAVTVQMGGAVPSSVTAYVAPGATRDVPFVTNSAITSAAKTSDGGSWLSLALDANGSFLVTYPYRIRFAPSSTMSGSYSGTLTTSGSSFAPDNKSVAVTMQVTTQPIAQASVSQVNVLLAQGQPAATAAVPLTNLGMGTLTVSGVTTTGGSWLTATTYSGGALLTLTPGSLTAGTYTGSVTIASNAANGSITVPVNFQIEAQGPPSIAYQSGVNGATFAAGETVARGDIMSVFGDQLSLSPPASAGAPPLPTSLGGAKVLVNGNPVPLYFSSYGQLNFQIPYEVPNGVAHIQVQRDGQSSNTISVAVADRAPRLLLIGAGLYGAIQIYPDLAIPMPVGAFPGVNTRPATVGDTLTIYAIGLGPTNPSASTGQAAPAAGITTTAIVNFGGGIGGTPAIPAYAGLTPGYAGLYQVNVVVPQNVPTGIVNVSLVLGDSASNSVQIYVQ